MLKSSKKFSQYIEPPIRVCAILKICGSPGGLGSVPWNVI